MIIPPFETSTTRFVLYSPSKQAFFKKASYGCVVLTRSVTDAKTYVTGASARSKGIPWVYESHHEYVEIHKQKPPIDFDHVENYPLPRDFQVVPVSIVAHVK